MTLVNWLWIIFAIAFALGGVILLVRALFADRSRGRKRCPKCWYDMTGATSLVCTECGREAKSERRLYRTRHHWRAALLSVVLMLAGLGTYYGGEVHRDGWIRATPTVAYIALLPWLDQNITLRELVNRLNNGEPRQWEYRLLVHRCIGVLRSSDNPRLLVDAMDVLERVETGGRSSSAEKPWASWTRASDIAPEDVIDALVAKFDHPDEQVRLNALGTVGQFTNRARRALPALLGLLVDSDEQGRRFAVSAIEYLDHADQGSDAVFFAELFFIFHGHQSGQPEPGDDDEKEFCQRLGRCGCDQKSAREVFEHGLTAGSEFIRAISVYGLAPLAATNALVADQILGLSADPGEGVRRTVVAATASMPCDDRVRRVLANALDDSSVNVQLAALRAVGARGLAANEFASQVHSLLNNGQAFVELEAIKCVCVIGGDANLAVNTLLDQLRTGPRHFAISTDDLLDAMSRLSVESHDACAQIEPWLQSDDPERKSAAANAYAAMGGHDLDLATKSIFKALHASTRDGNARAAGSTHERWQSFALRGRFSTPLIEWMLVHEDPVNRIWGAYFLRHTWHAGVFALPQLRAMRNDPDPRVRTHVAEAIRRIEWAHDHPDWRPSR